MMHFDWVEFYSEFATKLLAFRNDRQTLIGKIQKVYADIGMKFPKMESDDILVDIEPFSIFGMFNKGITNANRTAIAKGMAAEFGVSSKVPENFDGIPVLNNLRATFYFFKGDRGENDMDNLWAVFSAAIALSDSDTPENRSAFSTAYDLVLKQPGIRWNITMGLYWIRPYTFVNLDSRNRWYISNPENMPADFVALLQGLDKVPDATKYLEIKDACAAALAKGGYQYKTFPELSYYAWIVSEQVNQEKKTEKSRDTVMKTGYLKWMAPLLRALIDLGGSATPQDACAKIAENENLDTTVLSEVRGKTKTNKFSNEVAFARNCLVFGGYIDKSIHGVWKITEEGRNAQMTDEKASDLIRALNAANRNKRDSSGAALADDNVSSTHYWMYAPGSDAKKWEEFYADGIMGIGWEEMGDLEAYASKEEMRLKMKEIYEDDSSMKNSAHATWQFCHDIHVGDVIFVKKGRSEILGRGIVDSDYEFDEERADYNNIRHVKWTHKGNWQLDSQTVLKTLTDVTPYTDVVEKVSALFADNDEIMDDEPETVQTYPAYTKEDFLEEVYLPEAEYDSLVGILRNKKNIILQGAPGVGKTFAAKRLAYSIMGEKDIDRVMMVQFHQSYSYEDFIMGFRPTASGFELKKGAFYNFCKKAEIDTDNDYFFIIDEINRGNLSKIFGELFMLIENDKRGISLQLLYSDEKFAVPENVYIIGMMNTADRSLAMLDYALRRRFAFIEMKPGFETEGFRAYRMALDSPKFDRLINCVSSLNAVISADESLGEGFCIGHSYFCNLTPESITDEALSAIVEYELIPLLKEYWFDEPNRVRDWSDNLRSAIK